MGVRTGQAGGLRFLHQRSPQRGAAAEGGRPPSGRRREAPPPLVEESQPSGLSGAYAHAPCWLKEPLSSKLRCCAPQLPPAVFSGPKNGQGRKLVKKIKIWKVLRMGLPIVENLSGLQESIFSLSRGPQLHFRIKQKNDRILLNLSIFPYCPCLGSLGLLSFHKVYRD